MKLFILSDYTSVVAEVIHSNASCIVIGPAAAFQPTIYWRSFQNTKVLAGVPVEFRIGHDYAAEPGGGILNVAHVVRSLELSEKAAASWRDAIASALFEAAKAA